MKRLQDEFVKKMNDKAWEVLLNAVYDDGYERTEDLKKIAVTIVTF
jgi:hypothetical protein